MSEPENGQVDSLLAGLVVSLAELGTVSPKESIRRALKVTTGQPGSGERVPLGAALPQVDVAAAGDAEARGDLVIVGSLGEGGMGIVHRARQRSLDREVAIKRAKRDAPASAVQALLDEARVTGSLEHPGIVPVHILGRDRTGEPVLVMKRIEGVSWSELIERADHPHWARLPSDASRFHVDTLIDVCHTLELAHSRGYVHRDLKPQNVMIGAYGEVYVLDWGIATRVTEAGVPAGAGTIPVADLPMVGTPAYMAPEMVSGLATARTDVYLLGGILHEILTGQPPHRGTVLADVLVAVLEGDPEPPGPPAPRELADICARALRRDPASRFSSVRDLRLALTEYLEHRSSIVLADEAERLLDRLRASRPVPRDGSRDAPEDRAASAASRRTATECRFACEQALRVWSGNTRARQIADDCVRCLVEVEIDSRDPDDAGALLAELHVPDPALADRIAHLRRDLDAEASRLRQLARAATDHDIHDRSRLRGVVLAILCGVALSFGVGAIALRRAEIATDYQLAIGLDSLFAVLTAIGVWLPALRRMRNRITDKLALGFLAVVAFKVVISTFGWLRDLPLDVTIEIDVASDILAASLYGIAIDRRILLAILPLAAGLAVMLLAPAYFLEAGLGAQVAAALPLALLWIRRAPEP